MFASLGGYDQGCALLAQISAGWCWILGIGSRRLAVDFRVVVAIDSRERTKKKMASPRESSDEDDGEDMDDSRREQMVMLVCVCV